MPEFEETLYTASPEDSRWILRLLNIRRIPPAAKVASIRERLASGLDPSVWPAWIELEDLREAVLHIRGPVFWATLHDADSFFRAFDDDETITLFEYGRVAVMDYLGEEMEAWEPGDPNHANVEIECVGTESSRCMLTWLDPCPERAEDWVALMQGFKSAVDEKMPRYTRERQPAMEPISSDLIRDAAAYHFAGGPERRADFREHAALKIPEPIYVTDGVVPIERLSPGGPECLIGVNGDIFDDVYALNLQCEVLWKTSLGGGSRKEIGWPTVVGDRVIIPTRRGVEVLRSTDGGRLWKFPVTGLLTRSPLVVGEVCYVETSNELIALHAWTGELIHRLKLPSVHEARWPGASAGDGAVYLLRGERAYKIRENRIVWESDVPAGSGYLAILPDRIVIAGAGGVSSLSREDGQVLFHFDLFKEVQPLKPKDEDESWLEFRSQFDSPAAVAGNTIVCADTFGRLHGIDASVGRLLWSNDFDGRALERGCGPTIVGDTAYFVTGLCKPEYETLSDPVLVAVNVKDGSLIWRLEHIPREQADEPDKSDDENDDREYFKYASVIPREGSLYALTTYFVCALRQAEL